MTDHRPGHTTTAATTAERYTSLGFVLMNFHTRVRYKHGHCRTMRIKQTLTVALFKFLKDSLSNAFSAITLANPRLGYMFMERGLQTVRYVPLKSQRVILRTD